VPVALRTPLCERLGIDVPILAAGMGSLAGPDLVAAVSEAGGFGVLGVSGEQERYSGVGSPLVGFEGDFDYVALWAGESVEVVNDVLPGGELVRRLADEARDALTLGRRPA
jgi:NAD(P)H-dependent flavin oxidoreductase YrpB (nitropropane dioxygenase family)